jgi:hypothetical protein
VLFTAPQPGKERLVYSPPFLLAERLGHSDAGLFQTTTMRFVDRKHAVGEPGTRMFHGSQYARSDPPRLPKSLHGSAHRTIASGIVQTIMTW